MRFDPRRFRLLPLDHSLFGGLVARPPQQMNAVPVDRRCGREKDAENLDSLPSLSPHKQCSPLVEGNELGIGEAAFQGSGIVSGMRIRPHQKPARFGAKLRHLLERDRGARDTGGENEQGDDLFAQTLSPCSGNAPAGRSLPGKTSGC